MAEVPIYVPDERYKPGFVRIGISIPGLKTQWELKWEKLSLKFERAVANGELFVHLSEKSLSLRFVGHEELEGKQYELIIPQLVASIDPDESKIRVENDNVLLLLCKADREASWAELIDTNGGIELLD